MSTENTQPVATTATPKTDGGPVDYVVLIDPPHGSPRVVEVPRVSPEVAALMPPLSRFQAKADADAALEKFLTQNPEYRRWRDGRIQA